MASERIQRFPTALFPLEVVRAKNPAYYNCTRNIEMMNDLSSLAKY